MEAQKTEVSFLIDRSGSMQFKIEQVVAGFNQFIKDQKEVEGDCYVSFFQFDNEFETVYENKHISDVELMTQKDFSPRGSTALLDAIGRTIGSLGDRYRNMEEDERPDNVILAVITDGQENASTEFNKGQIKEMIEHQETKYKWNIIFLSEDLSAVGDAQSYFRGANTMGVADISRGMARVSSYTTYSRTVNNNATLDEVPEDEEVNE